MQVKLLRNYSNVFAHVRICTFREGHEEVLFCNHLVLGAYMTSHKF